MGTFIDLTGRVFGRWTVLSHAGRVAKDEAVNGKSVGQSLWLCRCECGVEREVLYGSLTRGGSQSCGCLRAELNWTNATHGLSRSMEQTIYQSMKTRCCNANHASFRRYGARGIKVCERWLSGSDNKTGFECFLEDMGRRPGKLTLERKNNDGHYLALDFVIIDGPFENRHVYGNLNLDNKNPVAVDIADEELAELAQACGKPSVRVPMPGESLDDLHGIPVLLKIGVEPARGQFEAKNKIKGYRPKDTRPTTSAPTTGQKAAPWSGKK